MVETVIRNEDNRDYGRGILDRLDELIGEEVVVGDDGFRLWFPTTGKGGWPSWALRVIADWMDDRDAEHIRGIRAYFEGDDHE